MPPTIAGTNCITTTEDTLIDTIAGLAAFQAFVGADDFTEAKAKIFLHDVSKAAPRSKDPWTDEDWIAIFPCCIIVPPEDASIFEARQTSNSGSAGTDIIIDFRWTLRFERLEPASTDEQDAIRAVMNAIGDIIHEWIESVGTLGTFGWTRLKALRSPYVGAYGKIPVQGWSFEISREISEG